MKLRVQRDTGGLLRVNAGDDGVMAEPAGADNQFLQQQRSDAAPVELMMDIDRVLNRAPVGRARVKSRK